MLCNRHRRKIKLTALSVQNKTAANRSRLYSFFYPLGVPLYAIGVKKINSASEIARQLPKSRFTHARRTSVRRRFVKRLLHPNLTIIGAVVRCRGKENKFCIRNRLSIAKKSFYARSAYLCTPSVCSVISLLYYLQFVRQAIHRG